MGWQRGQAYSDDLRQRVLAADGSSRAVAARFGVSISYVIKARQRRERCGETSARRQGSRRTPVLAPLHETIRAHVHANDDHTLDEMRAWLQETHGVRVSIGAMWNTLRRLGLTLKKKSCRRPSRPSLRSPTCGGAGLRTCRSSTPIA